MTAEASETGYEFGSTGVPAEDGETWGELAERLQEEKRDNCNCDQSVPERDVNRLAMRIRSQGEIFGDDSREKRFADWCAKEAEALLGESWEADDS